MNISVREYQFFEVNSCEMCGSLVSDHRLLGQRLNQSQGRSPEKKGGISVSIMRCQRCGLIFSNPMPVPKSIQDHYGLPAEDYWSEEYFEYHPDYFKSELGWLGRLMPFAAGMRALDIGAGLGKCMISLQNHGFEAYGFEPSTAFYEKALTKMKISPSRLKSGMMESVEYPGEFFDFITFGAVLEHLYHPAKSIEKALTWLKPGGMIHIEVPSSDYLISKLLNRYNALRGTNYVSHLSPMHPPFHLYEFTNESFVQLGRRLGFEISDHRIFVGKTAFFPAFLRSLVDRYMEKNSKGMQLTIWLRKSKSHSHLNQ